MTTIKLSESDINEAVARKLGVRIGEDCMDGSIDEYYTGWICDKCGGTGEWGNTAHFVKPKNYSTDISAAWEVVQKLTDLGWDFRLDGAQKYSVSFYLLGNNANAEADTAPMAIALAFLKLP